jgi:hypothetical protein
MKEYLYVTTFGHLVISLTDIGRLTVRSATHLHIKELRNIAAPVDFFFSGNFYCEEADGREYWQPQFYAGSGFHYGELRKSNAHPICLRDGSEANWILANLLHSVVTIAINEWAKANPDAVRASKMMLLEQRIEEEENELWLSESRLGLQRNSLDRLKR